MFVRNKHYTSSQIHKTLQSLSSMEFRPLLKNNSIQNAAMILSLLAIATLIVLSLGPFRITYKPVVWKTASLEPASTEPAAAAAYRVVEEAEYGGDQCDIFSGEWVPNPDAPYYTNSTCWAIHEYQNCMKYGRPDDGFMKWRWKPDGCELPVFNPFQFLDMMRGKSMAFVGDSMGRNHMQSLICLLSRVEFPIFDNSVPNATDYFGRWKYPSYNFTLAAFWTTFLVKAEEEAETKVFNMHVDELNEKWSSNIHEFDYVIINTGQWFYRPSIYYENKTIVGCHGCADPAIPELSMIHGFRKAWNTAFRGINGINSEKSVTVFLRTYSPPHFEGGEWNKGGDCVRKRPFRGGEIRLDGVSLELYLAELEEFKAAEIEGRKRGIKFRLLDITRAMLLRPDGHPSKFGHLPNVTVYNDCVHWCLPGPVDSWNDFLIHMLEMEGMLSGSFGKGQESWEISE